MRPNGAKGVGLGTAPLRFPWLSLLVSACAAAVSLVPAWAEALAFDRTAVAAGELWRLAGGHFSHWSLEHLAWDLGTFALLGSLCETRDRRRFALCTGLAMLGISAVLWLRRPEFATYRGLSGLDVALFTLLAVEMMRQWSREGRRGVLLLALAFLAAFAGKLGYELATGGTVFVQRMAPGVVLVPEAHLAGAAAGLLAGWLPSRPSCLRAGRPGRGRRGGRGPSR